MRACLSFVRVRDGLSSQSLSIALAGSAATSEHSAPCVTTRRVEIEIILEVCASQQRIWYMVPPQPARPASGEHVAYSLTAYCSYTTYI